MWQDRGERPKDEKEQIDGLEEAPEAAIVKRSEKKN